MTAIRRQIFKRGYDFICVRPIQLSTKDFIRPGTLIDKSRYRLYQLRSWYERRRIGVHDSDWSKAMLAQADNALALPEVTGARHVNTVDSHQSPVINELGKGWYDIVVGDDVIKMRGRSAVDQWLEERGYATS